MKRLLVLTLTVIPVLTTHAGQITLIFSGDQADCTMQTHPDVCRGLNTLRLLNNHLCSFAAVSKSIKTSEKRASLKISILKIF